MTDVVAILDGELAHIRAGIVALQAKEAAIWQLLKLYETPETANQSTTAGMDRQRSKEERADRKPQGGGSPSVTDTSGPAGNADQGKVAGTSAEAARGPQTQSISPAGTQAPPVEFQSQEPPDTVPGGAPRASLAGAEGDADRQPIPEPLPDTPPVEVAPEKGAPSSSSDAGKSAGPSGSAAPGPTLKQLVAPIMAEHPDWTASQIAKEVGRPKPSVLTTMSVIRREKAQEAAPDTRAVVVVPAPKPELDPAPAPAAERPQAIPGDELPNLAPGPYEAGLRAKRAEARRRLGMPS